MSERGEMNKGGDSESRATSSATEPIINIYAANTMMLQEQIRSKDRLVGIE